MHGPQCKVESNTCKKNEHAPLTLQFNFWCLEDTLSEKLTALNCAKLYNDLFDYQNMNGSFSFCTWPLLRMTRQSKLIKRQLAGTYYHVNDQSRQERGQI